MSLNVFDLFDHHSDDDETDQKRLDKIIILTAFYLKVLHFTFIGEMYIILSMVQSFCIF